MRPADDAWSTVGWLVLIVAALFALLLMAGAVWVFFIRWILL